MPGLNPQQYDAIKKGMAEAKARKSANRQSIGNAYQELMGSPQDPQDHPANNVSHPHGNRGLNHATVPLNVPMTPNTGEYQDEINY